MGETAATGTVGCRLLRPRPGWMADGNPKGVRRERGAAGQCELVAESIWVSRSKVAAQVSAGVGGASRLFVYYTSPCGPLNQKIRSHSKRSAVIPNP